MDRIYAQKNVAGNWKMNGSRYEAYALLESIKQGAGAFSAIDIAVFPAFVICKKVKKYWQIV